LAGVVNAILRKQYTGFTANATAGTPQDRANLVLSWDRGPWNVTRTVR
jgi:hypothetical protein